MNIKESIVDKFVDSPLTDDGHVGLTLNIYGYIDFAKGIYGERLRNTTTDISSIDISQFKKDGYTSWTPVVYKMKYIHSNTIDLVVVLIRRQLYVGHHLFFALDFSWTNVGQSSKIVDLLIIDRRNNSYKFYYGDDSTGTSDTTGLKPNVSDYDKKSSSDFWIKQTRQEFDIGYTDFIFCNNKLYISYMDKEEVSFTVDKLEDNEVMPAKAAKGRTYAQNGICHKVGSKSISLLKGRPKLYKYKVPISGGECIELAYNLVSSGGIYDPDCTLRYGMNVTGGYTTLRLAMSELKPNYIFLCIRYECYLQLPYKEGGFNVVSEYISYGYGAEDKAKIAYASYAMGNIVGFCGYEFGFIDTLTTSSADAPVTIMHSAPGESLPIASPYKSHLDEVNCINAWVYLARRHLKNISGELIGGGDPEDTQSCINLRDVMIAHNWKEEFQTSWFKSNNGSVALWYRDPKSKPVKYIMSNLPIYTEEELLPVIDRANKTGTDAPFNIPIPKAFGNITGGGSVIGTTSYQPSHQRYFAQALTHHSNSFMVTFSEATPDKAATTTTPAEAGKPEWPIFIACGTIMDVGTSSFLNLQDYFAFSPNRKSSMTEEPTLEDMQKIYYAGLGLERNETTKRATLQTCVEGNMKDGVYDPYDSNAATMINFDCEWRPGKPRQLYIAATVVQTPSPLLGRGDVDYCMWMEAKFNNTDDDNGIMLSDVLTGVRAKEMYSGVSQYNDEPTKIDLIPV